MNLKVYNLFHCGAPGFELCCRYIAAAALLFPLKISIRIIYERIRHVNMWEAFDWQFFLAKKQTYQSNDNNQIENKCIAVSLANCTTLTHISIMVIIGLFFVSTCLQNIFLRSGHYVAVHSVCYKESSAPFVCFENWYLRLLKINFMSWKKVTILRSTEGMEAIILITHDLTIAMMEQRFSRFPKLVEFTAEILSQSTINLVSTWSQLDRLTGVIQPHTLNRNIGHFIADIGTPVLGCSFIHVK
jgi:hypothetical protein